MIKLSEVEKRILMSLVSLIKNIPVDVIQQLEKKLLISDERIFIDGEEIKYKKLYCYRLCRKTMLHIKLRQETAIEEYYVCQGCGNIKTIVKRNDGEE